jgi:Leucine-rich repeat (LRR) protein
VKYIDLSYSKVFRLNDFIFNISSLIEINLRGNLLNSLSALVFSGARNLQKIDLSSNNLKLIEPEAFLNLPSLYELNLSHNAINNNTFNRNGADWVDLIESLRVLDLSYNELTFSDALPYQTFSGLVNIESLNLRSNEITVDYGIFASNHHLKTLDFSYNKMTYFDINFLMSIESLENLFLHGNGIAYASQVDLNDIRTTFPKIKSLGISDNGFSCEVLSKIIKKMLQAKIELIVDEGSFVVDKRNLRGVACN